MLTNRTKKMMRDYLDTLPLVKETKGGTTYWFLPETDSDEWVAHIDITCRVITEVRVEEHPSFGPQIATYHSSVFQDFKSFKNAIDYAMVLAEDAQRKYHFMHNEWKAEHMRDCAKNFEV
jgi:hypothetical protein